MKRLAILVLSACASKAPPMEGECIPIEVDHYEATRKIGPTMHCLWRDRSWDCTDHWELLGEYWSCDAAPAVVVRP